MKVPPERKRGAGRPRGSSGDVTRIRIIEAARGCFGARGFGATTNREIGDAAGITPAAIYRYFPSKLALFLACVEASLAALEPALRGATADCEGGRDELVALVEAAAALHRERPWLAAFLSSLPVEMKRHPEIAAAMNAEPDAVSRLMAEAVARAHARGQLAPGVEAGHVMAMVIACNMGLSLWGAAIQGEGSAEAMRAYARLLAGGLFVG